MSVDIDRVSALIAATAAEEIMPRFRRLAAGDVREKAPGDVVTIADEAAEARLAPQLADLLPGSIVVGEEAAAGDPALLNRLFDRRAIWVIDPLDGTSNFAEGRPDFAVMVGLVRGGDIVAGWIHDPVNDRMAVAEAGEGAWLDGNRLRVAAAPPEPRDMSGTLLSGFFGRRDLSLRVQQRRQRVRALPSLRCAGLEYMRLAGGDMHFSLFTKLMPWDHVPGILLHREAGGHAAYVEGGAYHPAQTDQSGLLLAPDDTSWAALHETLFGEA